MSSISQTTNNWVSLSSDLILKHIVRGWVGIALLGQWTFALYILSLYALPLFIGATTQAADVTPTQGFDTSASFNSIMFFTHIIPAALMAMSGMFQLFPKFRARYPKFHRWNGRMFFVLGLSGALTGLYLTWGAGLRLSDFGALGITLNGLLIPIAIFLAWRAIRNKNIMQHERWAIHSFLLVNGVWTFRLYLMGWYLVNQGPNGNSNTLDGPMDIFISYACYLLPMLFAELIFWARRKKDKKINIMVIATTSVALVFTLIGITAAGMMMWGPRISQMLSSVL